MTSAPLSTSTPTGVAGRSAPATSGSRGLYGSEIGKNMARAGVAELLGTFLLVFTGTAVAVSGALGRPIAGDPADSLAVALAFGLVLVALVSTLGHVSGAHLNPAVTLGLAATRKFPWRYVPAYLAAQLAGAVLGALGTWISFGAPGRDQAALAATAPAAGVGPLQALAVEAIVTFVLVFVVISVATDERVADTVAPIAVGAALTVGVFVAGPVTGGAVNPVRALGPMIVSGSFPSWWVYLLGPIVGGVVAAVAYDRFVGKAETPEPS